MAAYVTRWSWLSTIRRGRDAARLVRLRAALQQTAECFIDPQYQQVLRPPESQSQAHRGRRMVPG
jgi:hypothetical protein